MRHHVRMREKAVLRWINLATAVVLAWVAFSGLRQGDTALAWGFLLLATGANIGITVEWLRQYHLGLVRGQRPPKRQTVDQSS